MLFLIVILLVSFQIKSSDKIASIENILNPSDEKRISEELRPFFVPIQKKDEKKQETTSNTNPSESSTKNNMESRDDYLNGYDLMSLIQELSKENQVIRKSLLPIYGNWGNIINFIHDINEETNIMYRHILWLSYLNKNLESKVEELNTKVNGMHNIINGLHHTINNLEQDRISPTTHKKNLEPKKRCLNDKFESPKKKRRNDKKNN